MPAKHTKKPKARIEDRLNAKACYWLPKTTIAAIKDLANADRRSASFVVADALAAYVAGHAAKPRP